MTRKKIILRSALILLLCGLTTLYSGCLPFTCDKPEPLLKIRGTVAGYVYQYNRPMPSFKVQLIDQSGWAIATAPTNAHGHFIIKDVPPGDYIVYVLTFAGVPYVGYEGHITVRPGRTEKIDIDLGGGELPRVEGE